MEFQIDAQDALCLTHIAHENVVMPVGSRIRQIRKAKGMTILDVATRIDSDVGNLSRLERDKQGYTDELLRKLATVFGVKVTEFFEDGASNIEPVVLPKNRPVPIIGYVQAGLWTEATDPYAMGGGDGWVTPDEGVGKNAFALRIKGDSNYPDYKEGEIVIIDPDISPQPGDFVAAKNGEEEATFKKFRPRGTDENGKDVFELAPLNEDFPTLYSDRDGPMRIVGTMVEHRRFRRR